MTQPPGLEAALLKLESSDKLGDIKKLARTIKRDHELALALWETGRLRARLLATLIMDRKLLDGAALKRLAAGAADHEPADRNQLSDWLLANQLSKSKRTRTLLESWEHHDSPFFRRLFWYHQARLRWTGRTPPANTAALLESLESNLAGEAPEVQWAMNFTAGWIGVHEPEHRARCVELGLQHGLYKGEKVSKGCTPSYLPEFIRIEVAKRT